MEKWWGKSWIVIKRSAFGYFELALRPSFWGTLQQQLQGSFGDGLTLDIFVSTGSPSRGGDVAVYVSEINQPSLPTPFFCSCVCFCLYSPFNCISFLNSPDNSPLSHSILPVLFCLIGPFNYISPLWKSPSALIFCPCVCFRLYCPFNCISFHKFSWQLSVFLLCSSGLITVLLVLSTYFSLWKSPSALI